MTRDRLELNIPGVQRGWKSPALEPAKRLLEGASAVNRRHAELAQATRSGFNIFSILRQEDDEVGLHSRFIFELLNPAGAHGMAARFLQLFLEQLDLAAFDLDGVSVQREYRGIDLLITNATQAVVIENKIFAPDQPGQLQRYYREMTREGYTTIHLVYLTLHGETPGAESAGHLDELVLSISYQDDLMPWLDACIQAAGAYPAVHEVLKQYQHVVAGLTGQAQGRKMIDVKALIADEEHLAAAISIGQALEQLKIDLLFRFWIRLEERLLAEGFEILDYWKYSRKRVERYYQKHPHRHGILVALPELLGNESLGFFVGVYKRLYYGFIALENGAPAALAHEPRFALLTRLLKQLDPRWQVGSETLGWRRPERDLDFVNFSTPHTLALIDPAQIGAYMEGLIDEIQYTIAKFYAACETELPAQLMDGAL